MQKCFFATHQMHLVLLCFLRSKKQRQCKMYLMLCKNIFDAKMHLMQKCIFATRTFSFGKCSASHFVGAEHFPLKNVQQSKASILLLCSAQWHILWKIVFFQNFVKQNLRKNFLFTYKYIIIVQKKPSLHRWRFKTPPLKYFRKGNWQKHNWPPW